MTDETTFTTERPRRRRRFTDDSINTWADFKPGNQRRAVPHPTKLGHYVIVQSSGVRSWAVEARDPVLRKQVWKTYGRCDRMSVAEAAAKGDEIIARIRKGLPPVEPPTPKPETLTAVFEQWFQLHVEAEGLRTAKEIRRRFERYVKPRLGDRPFVELRKSDLNKLIDAIVTAGHGARQADQCATTLISLQRWYSDRHDYPVSFVGVKRRDKAKSRDRTLSHDEIRTLWHAAEAPDAGAFGAIVCLALLTGQRKEKLATMKHADVVDGVVVDTVHEEVIDGRIVKKVRRETFDGVWRIPQAPREKDAGGDLVLPKAARDIIAAQPRFGVNPYVFPKRFGAGHIHVVLSSPKRTFDARLPAGFEYHIHDLRRTARSLMSAAGVDRDVAERILGHRIGTKVARTYDQFAYVWEKADGLQKLADLIAIILKGPQDNVTDLQARGPRFVVDNRPALPQMSSVTRCSHRREH